MRVAGTLHGGASPITPSSSSGRIEGKPAASTSRHRRGNGQRHKAPCGLAGADVVQLAVDNGEALAADAAFTGRRRIATGLELLCMGYHRRRHEHGRVRSI